MKEQVGKRLKQALDRRERSIRNFQQALYDQHVHGSSYASVHQYVKGRTLPPLDFLEGAAKELDVRVSWLVSGEGLMGVEDEERDFEEALADLIIQRHPWLGAMPGWNLQQFRDLVLQYQMQIPNGLFLGDKEQLLELADDLAFLVTLPLRSWGFREPYPLGGEQSEHDQLPAAIFAPYFRLMIDVLSLAMKQPTMSGDGLDQRPGSLIPSLRRALEQGLPEPSTSELEKARAAQGALDQVFPDVGES